MRSNWKAIGVIAAIAICSAAGYATRTGAAEEKSMVVPPPANAPTQPAMEMPMPTMSPAAAATDECCEAPCIKYWTHLGARLMLRCNSEIQVTMSVDNPADCKSCKIEVPMCIPCCCTGEPTVTSDCGLLGRGIVEYCWPCGFRATVVFRPTLGDVMVHYSA
jgi:hypothetical protein